MSSRTKRGARHGIARLAVMFNGKTLAITDEDGHPIYDDSFLIMVNAAHEGVEFVLPAAPAGTTWIQFLDTENGKNPFAKVRPRKKGHPRRTFFARLPRAPSVMIGRVTP